jgi:NDP-sugar pyrophosphorylase family protein
MNAMVLAAGLGTRLKPWTLTHPKALVPVGGVPMLQRVIENLREQGFDRIVVNVHHFAGQVVQFLNEHDFGIEVMVSDETGCLLDTGGGLLNARGLLKPETGPVLIHNTDIISNADLRRLMERHIETGADSTLLVSSRNSSRRLVFDPAMRLEGWHNVQTGEFRPAGFVAVPESRELAFSGIHVAGEKLFAEMERIMGHGKFSIIDFLLSPLHECDIMGFEQRDLSLIDIGKPETLSMANKL